MLAHKSASGSAVENKIITNYQLPEELRKPIIRKFEKGKVYSSLKDNIWGADLAGIQLISKFNKVFCFLLCLIHIYHKYVWDILLK